MTDQAKRLMDASYSRVVAEVRALRQERDEALMLAAHPDISTLKDLAREVVYRGQRMLDLEAALAAFAPYLKDGETPIERLERERRDNNLLMGLLAKEKAHVEMVERVEGQRVAARDKEIADLQIERSLADKDRDAARADRDRFQRELAAERAKLDGWVKWASSSRCIYCGQEFQHDPQHPEEADEAKKAHVRVCEKHPLAAEREARQHDRDLTCGCGIYVHHSRWNPKARHIADCPYATLADREALMKELDAERAKRCEVCGGATHLSSLCCCTKAPDEIMDALQRKKEGE